MSTRSNIAILNDDGTVTAIYCHWDGIININGKILLKNYHKKTKVEELIKHGDLSSLHAEIEPTERTTHTADIPQKDVCVFYHRDGGYEYEETKPKTYLSITDIYNKLKGSWIEYLYIYIGNDWYYSNLVDDEKLELKHLKSEIEYIEGE